MEHNVIIALGSNVASHFLIDARSLLTHYLNIVRASDIIATKPVGMVSPDFHNQLLLCTTTLCLDSLGINVKNTEQTLGRRHGEDTVCIDIDIMKYDNTLLHLQDWERDYIKRLYSQIK